MLQETAVQNMQHFTLSPRAQASMALSPTHPEQLADSPRSEPWLFVPPVNGECLAAARVQRAETLRGRTQPTTTPWAQQLTRCFMERRACQPVISSNTPLSSALFLVIQRSSTSPHPTPLRSLSPAHTRSTPSRRARTCPSARTQRCTRCSRPPHSEPNAWCLQTPGPGCWPAQTPVHTCGIPRHSTAHAPPSHAALTVW
jgi:hypothetical protein